MKQHIYDFSEVIRHENDKQSGTSDKDKDASLSLKEFKKEHERAIQRKEDEIRKLCKTKYGEFI